MKTFILENKFHLFILLITLLYVVYIGDPSKYYFLNDDFVHIPQAADLNFLNDSSFVRPISNFTLWLDYIIWEKNAYGYHLTNLIIHLINVGLVFFTSKILYKNFGKDNNWQTKSFICCTVFLVYAFHSESIFWIIGRGSSLTTVFFLSAFICFLKSQNSFFNSILCLVFFYLGLFTYELIWIFPLIVSLHYYFYKNAYRIKLVYAIWVSFLIFFIIKIFILENIVLTYELGALNTFNFYTLIFNFNTLFSRVFLPPLLNSIVFLILYLILIFVLSVFIYKNKRNRLLLFSFSGILISILPAITLGIDTHDTESERFIYLSTFFAIIFITEILQTFKKFKRLSFTVLLCIHLFFLNDASKAYKTASLISSNSLFCLKSGKYDSLDVYNLPTQYKGALIFRTGFEEAVEWIVNKNIKSIVISTKSEVYNKKVKFKCNELESSFNHEGVLKNTLLNSKEIILYNYLDGTVYWDL